MEAARLASELQTQNSATVLGANTPRRLTLCLFSNAYLLYLISVSGPEAILQGT